MKFFFALATVITTLCSPVFASWDVAQKNACMACHALDKKLVGPSYSDVAKRYENQRDAAVILARSIKVGGSGKWGAIPMPSQAALSDLDALTLANWILSTPSTVLSSSTERNRLNIELEVERKKRQDLENQLAYAKESVRIASELDLERRKRQELQSELDRAKETAETSSAYQQRPQVSPVTERRVALVIGNANYKLSPLENSVNDATDFDQALKRFGFQTTLLRNATLGQIREATRRFAEQLANADVALIYFAGHGIESKSKNYMIPINSDLKFEYELADQAYDAGAWLEMLEMVKSNNSERVNIVILDACRNNNLIGARTLNRGLGRMDAPSGTFLSFSTAPGKVAGDGARGERNSPFTKNLLKAIQQPGKPIEEVFKDVRRNVSRETNGAQIPWESTSLTGFFSFK